MELPRDLGWALGIIFQGRLTPPSLLLNKRLKCQGCVRRAKPRKSSVKLGWKCAAAAKSCPRACWGGMLQQETELTLVLCSSLGQELMPDDVFCHLVLFIIKIRLCAAKKKNNPNQNPSTQQNQPKIAEILWVSPPNPGIFYQNLSPHPSSP